jgi:hypothetical protein
VRAAVLNVTANSARARQRIVDARLRLVVDTLRRFKDDWSKRRCWQSDIR